MDHAYNLLDALLLVELDAARNRYLAQLEASARAQAGVSAGEAGEEGATARSVAADAAAAQARER